MKNTATQTKKEQRAAVKLQMGRGQRMITGAEFEYGISRSISREEFDTRINAGNRLILNALDGILEAAQ